MKKLKTLGLSVFFGLLSAGAMANTEQTTPQATQEPTAVVQNTEVVQKVVNPNSVNINSATAAELQSKLTGIGAKKAEAIVEYREKHGKFVNIEQLTEISGIGKATLDKNRDRIVLE
ncbi:transporter [Pasteurellaceae bacterium 15-036681]|nr:transporter [Pasteurellaceae bacterium 15-036681]